ncbi:MAG: UvrD-helicase domain-containing protein [Comamonadaceae bacterium]|nr:UvrD-helicase domain-containing protein [Comamonadaceae bacterium]
MDEPALAGEIGERFDHVLVDEYQDTNRLQADDPARAEARRPRPHGGRRRRAGDLRLPRAPTVRNILDFPRAVRRRRRAVVTLERNYRSTQPILDAANAVIALAQRALHQGPVERRARRRAAAARRRAPTRPTQARYVVDAGAGRSARTGIALKSQAVLFRAVAPQRARSSSSSARRNIPFVKFGGLKFLEAAHVKDVLAVPALGAEPARPRSPASASLQLLPGVGPATARAAARRAWRPPTRPRALAGFAAAARPRGPTGRARATARPAARPTPRLAGGSSSACAAGTEPHLRAPARRRRTCARPTCEQLDADRRRAIASRERFLTELTLDPPERHQRRGRRAAAATRTT